jgi:membrane protein implicated in regulation of membrane protease activity
MNILLLPYVWLVAGVVLVLAEIIIPGGVIIFLGLGCLVVAGAVALGIVTSGVNALTLFFVSSLFLVLTLRALFMRFAGGESSRGNINEILDDVGEEAPVIEAIGPGNSKGLIEYHGTRWQALGDGQLIEPGQHVRIVGRDNVVYIVELVQAT